VNSQFLTFPDSRSKQKALSFIPGTRALSPLAQEFLSYTARGFKLKNLNRWAVRPF
jgi:hypothetical protein